MWHYVLFTQDTMRLTSTSQIVPYNAPTSDSSPFACVTQLGNQVFTLFCKRYNTFSLLIRSEVSTSKLILFRWKIKKKFVDQVRGNYGPIREYLR